MGLQHPLQRARHRGARSHHYSAPGASAGTLWSSSSLATLAPVGSRQRRDTKLAWGKTAAVSELLCQSQTREMRVADARFWAGLG